MNREERFAHNAREEMWVLMCLFAEEPEWDIMLIDTLPYGARTLNTRLYGG